MTGAKPVRGNLDGSMMYNMDIYHHRKRPHIVVVLLSTVVVVMVIVLIVLVTRPAQVVTSFAQCKAAGGTVMESYPEQCKIDGVNFVNDEKPLGDNSYVGLSESDALAKAKQAKIPARVVEREGEMVPVTADFAFGRYNLFIKDGKVYKVEIEGQAVDTNK